MIARLRVLHLEDDPVDVELVRSILAADHLDCAITAVATRLEFEAALRRGDIDLVLADFSLPAFDGLAALEIVRRGCPALPVILVSGMTGEELAVDALHRGATDFVLKSRLFRLVPAIRRAMAEVDSIVERRRLEGRLIESQKMEVAGQLSGGLAHDFNNILAAIMGYNDLIAEKLAPQDPLRTYTDRVRHAAERAAALTRQLLVFSRLHAVQPVTLDLNDAVRDVEPMLRQLVDENIEMSIVPSANLGFVSADPGYVGQVVMNLVVNARDAMPTGGSLTIETGNVTVQARRAVDHGWIAPGDYVVVRVTDTGMGMAEAVRARLFEPFFTTKPEGKGTGLGLLTCLTIVQHSGGCIDVESALGRGSTFNVYLPRVAAPDGVEPRPTPVESPSRGTETLLLVENERWVRQLACGVLRAQGYEVLSASNGEDGLCVARAHKGAPVRLIITDVIMPMMGGRAIVEQLRANDADLKVLFTSSHADQTIRHHGVLDPGVEFLPKPYSSVSLARRVRKMLDASAASVVRPSMIDTRTSA